MTADPQTLRSRLPGFRERFPWLGADLQTVRNMLFDKPAELGEWPAERMEVAAPDESGDRMVMLVHRPAQAPRGPALFLVHGLGGDCDSIYIRRTARRFLLAGHPVARVNLRGAGLSRPISAGQYHGGRSADAKAML